LYTVDRLISDLSEVDTRYW